MNGQLEADSSSLVADWSLFNGTLLPLIKRKMNHRYSGPWRAQRWEFKCNWQCGSTAGLELCDFWANGGQIQSPSAARGRGLGRCAVCNRLICLLDFIYIDLRMYSVSGADQLCVRTNWAFLYLCLTHITLQWSHHDATLKPHCCAFEALITNCNFLFCIINASEKDR